MPKSAEPGGSGQGSRRPALRRGARQTVAARPFDMATNVELAQLGTRDRLVFASAFAAFSLLIHPWMWAVTWLAVLLAWEIVVRVTLERPLLQMPAGRARTMYAAVNFFGAC